MKKMMPILCAVTILTAPIASQVQAETTSTTSQPTTTGTTTSDSATTTLPDNIDWEQIKKANIPLPVTVEDIIKLALNNNNTLRTLYYNLEALKYQKLDTQFDIDQLGFDINDVNSSISKIVQAAKEKDPQATVDLSGQYKAIDGINDQIEALQLALKNMNSGQVQLETQMAEVKEGMRLLVISEYTNVLLMQKQQQLANKSLSLATAEVKKAQRLFDLGRGSKDALRAAKTSQRTAQKQVNDLTKKYKQTINDFASDIGIPKDVPFALQPIMYTVSTVTVPEDFTTLIDKSFKVIKAKEDLKIATDKRDDTIREYNNYDSSGIPVSNYQLEQQNNLVKAAETTFTSTKSQVEKSLKTIYFNADVLYDNYQETLANLQDAQDDYTALQKKYKLGLVAKQTFEAASIKVDQANLNVDIAYMQYYQMQQSIQAAALGYLQ